MSKQDRQGVRTAPELERRYGFGKSFREVRSGIQTVGKTAEQTMKTAASAAETAQDARAAIDGMTVEAQTLAPGSAASVEKTNTGGVTNFRFGIPAGPAGPQGAVGPQGAQGIQGPPGPQGIAGVAVQTSGYVTFTVSEEGHLLCSYAGAEAPGYSINDDGHLILEYEGGT